MKILTDTRDGERQGFDPDVAKGLMSLLTLHGEAYPQFSPQLDQLWDEWCGRL